MTSAAFASAATNALRLLGREDEPRRVLRGLALEADLRLAVGLQLLRGAEVGVRARGSR